MDAIPVTRGKRNISVDERIHWSLSKPGMLVSEFNQRLFHRHEVAQRNHARWSAHRIAAILKRSYAMNDIRFISDTLLDSELRKYRVSPDMWSYGRKVVLERLKKAWSV